MGKPKKRRKPEAVEIVGPTDEQMARAEYRRANLAYRRTPVIDTLLDAGKLTDAEFRALHYYRDQACRAEDDYARESTLSPSRVMGGGRGTSTPGSLIWTPAIAETSRIERDLGVLLDIARAIAVDDVPLTEYCISKHGGRERYNGRGRFIAIVPNNQALVEKAALLDLKMAARRIVC